MRAALLSPLAAAWAAAATLRAALYARGWLRPTKLSVPVISVGNLAAGGTGKTPMVALAARLLRDAGLRPAVVSRGYRGRRSEDPLIVSGESGPRGGVTAAQAGDEPVMLGRLLAGIPVIVSRRRAKGASLAVTRFGARCVLLDDGFQHLALHRDLDLVLLDACRPFDGGRLLPAGLLRERPAALGRADAIVLTGEEGGCGDAEALLRPFLRPGAPFFRMRCEPTLLVDQHGSPRPVGSLAGRRVVAFAGIARPDRFRRSLEALGAQVVAFLPFPDHHPVRAADVSRILAAAGAAGHDLLLTTEKDLARLDATPASGALRRAGLATLRVEGTMPEAELPAFRDLLVAVAGGPGEGP